VAALWTSPLAWGRVPIVGNVKLEILSERMIKGNSCSATGDHSEQLVVRWRTCGKTKGKGIGPYYKGIGANEQVDKITEFLGGGEKDDTKEFTGLFIFEFDEEGRIVSHTIEHVQSGGNWDKGVGARVVGLTDWLLGGLKGNGEEGHGQPCPAFWSEQRRR
jgi:Mitochondrial protein up-regulated during meiosis